MMLLGDLGRWCSEVLDRELAKIIDRNQFRENPYWIMVVNKTHYAGPKASAVETKDVLLKNNIINTTLVIIPEETMLPYYRQLGTALLKVDNKKGQAKWIYILPPDIPIMQPVEFDGESEFVGRSARGIPIKY